MRLPRFAAMHTLTVIGEVVIDKDQFARLYVNDTRVALVRSEGLFTALIDREGRAYYVLTPDWLTAQRLDITSARQL